MRLLFIAHGFPPEQPGVWTYHHVQELASRHDICVLALTTDPARQHFEQWQSYDRNVLIWRVNNLRVDHLRGFANPQIDEMIDYAIEYFSPDVVHCEHVIGLSTTLLTRTYNRRIPTVLALYDYYWVCPRVNLVRGDYSLCAGPSHSFDCVTCVDSPRIQPRQPLPGKRVPQVDPRSPSSPESQRWSPSLKERPHASVNNETDATEAEPWRLLLHDYRLESMRALIDYPEMITACSDSLRDDLTRMLNLDPGRIRTVTLGLPPLSEMKEHTSHAHLRVRYLGIIAPHKGVHVFAEASEQLADLPIEFHLHGASEPSYLQSVLAIAPALTFHGQYDRDQLAGILSETDLLVLPTLSRETFSFVIREATLAGVPVIASTLGSIPEFIRNDQNGLLVPPNSPQALAAAIRRCASDPALRARLGRSSAGVRSIIEYTAEMEGIYHKLQRARGRYSS